MSSMANNATPSAPVAGHTPGPIERGLASHGIRGPFFCTRCGEKLNPEKMVWLELDQRTSTYHDEGGIPDDKSQGGFTFGAACARRERAQHRLALSKAKEEQP